MRHEIRPLLARNLMLRARAHFSFLISHFCIAFALLLIAGCDSSPTPPPVMPTPSATRVSVFPTASPPGLLTATPAGVSTPGSGADSIVISGFPGPVLSLAWSPDGQALATGIGNPGSGGVSAISGAAVTPDPAFFTIRLWRPDGSRKATLTGHTGAVGSLAWSPDGKTLASGSVDATLRLWSPGGTLLRTINCDRGAVFAAAWSPDGTMIATGSVATPTQNTVQIWKLDGTLLHTLTTQYSGGKFYNLAWSPDGKYLVGGATDYKIWSAAGTDLGHVQRGEHGTPSWGMGWSPDSTKWAISNESGLVEIYDLHANSLKQMQGTMGANALAWSPDRKLIAAGVGLWTPDGTRVKDMNSTLGERVNGLAWSPDGRTLAAASDRKIVGLFTTQGLPITTFNGHADGVIRVAWSPDGKTLASSSFDGTVRLWKVGTDQ